MECSCYGYGQVVRATAKTDIPDDYPEALLAFLNVVAMTKTAQSLETQIPLIVQYSRRASPPPPYSPQLQDGADEKGQNYPRNHEIRTVSDCQDYDQHQQGTTPHCGHPAQTQFQHEPSLDGDFVAVDRSHVDG
jgi:hypothetical protein